MAWYRHLALDIFKDLKNRRKKKYPKDVKPKKRKEIFTVSLSGVFPSMLLKSSSLFFFRSVRSYLDK